MLILLYTLSACWWLAAALPPAERAKHSMSDGYPESPYRSSLKRRVHHPSSNTLSVRANTESIVDNLQLKFLLPVYIGGQAEPFDLELDTGSSDLWVIQSGFTCFSSKTFSSSSQVPASECNFGASYKPDSKFAEVSGYYMEPCYGNGDRCVDGAVGYTSTGFCGLTVPKQLIGVPLLSSYPAAGKQEQSGIIGMAYPLLTSLYDASTNEQTPYSSIMDTTLYGTTWNPPLQGAFFTLVISRDTSGNNYGGTLTIGGTPSLTDPTVGVSSTTWTYAPLQVVTSISATDYSFYSINVDGFGAGTKPYADTTQVIVDSGASIIAVPTSIANAFNSLWSPAGALDNAGDFIVPCDAEPATFGVEISGTWFYINPLDLMGQSNGVCYSLVSAADSGTGGSYVLGDPFLKNVVAVYDWGGKQMGFLPRETYES